MQTNPLIASSLDITVLLRDRNSLSDREQRAACEARATQLLLALQLFRMHEGRSAAVLGQLVPRYLPVLPADPFTGQSFHYRLSLGEAIRWPTRDGEADEVVAVTVGDGIVWSVGPDGADDGGTRQGLEVSSRDFRWKEGGLDLIFVAPTGGGK